MEDNAVNLELATEVLRGLAAVRALKEDARTSAIARLLPPPSRL